MAFSICNCQLRRHKYPLSCQKPHYYGHIQIGGYYYAKNNGSLRIKGGTFKPAGDSWLISNFGKLVIDKGNFQFPGTDTHYGILRTFKDCTINGGNFTTYGQYSILIDTNGFDGDRKSTRLNSSHPTTSRMPSSA